MRKTMDKGKCKKGSNLKTEESFRDLAVRIRRRVEQEIACVEEQADGSGIEMNRLRLLHYRTHTHSRGLCETPVKRQF